jgi:tetratricopeptide (TPR) repeat protein
MLKRLRNVLIFVLILAGGFAPVVVSGYTEIEKASRASSHLEAAEHYEAAARRLPWRKDLYELAGHYFYHARVYARASEAYQRAFERDSLSPEGWMAWGDVLYLDGNPQRAVEIWTQALDQPHHSEKLYSRLAEIYQQRGEYHQAALFLQRYVEKFPQDAAARYRLGLLLTLTDPPRAASELIHASQLDPQFASATQTLRTAVNLSALSGSAAEAKVIIGRGLGLVEEWTLAREVFDEAVQFDEKNAEAWAWLGEAEQHTAGNEALSFLDRALALDSSNPVVHGLRGLYFQRIGNHRQALSEFQAAAKLEPQNPAWYASIGEEFANLGDLITALEAYQYATTVAPQDAHYWRTLAEFCARNGAYVRDVGIPAARKALELKPKDPLTLDTLGWLMILDNRYYEAKWYLFQAVEADPQLASAHFHLALLYLQTGDSQSMYEHLTRARDLGSAEAQALLAQYFP